MPDVTVRPVRTRREKKQFTMLPWSLYRDDPHWVPPLRLDFLERVGFKHSPFYDDAEAQTFLAFHGNEPVGRVSAILNHAHNRQYNERRGFFGFFESIDDHRVAAALFDAARAWLAERDVHVVRGPVNPSMNYECGMLVEGFDRPPMFMMTYNPPYYDRLLIDYGFDKEQDMYAYWGHTDMLDTLDPKLQFIVDEAKRRFNITLRPMDRSRFYEEVRMFLDIYNESMAGMWGFVPLAPAEADHMAKGMKHLLAPELTTAAEIDGRMVGAVFGMLDYNPRIKRIDGRLFPFGFLRLIAGRRKIKNIRIISANVTTEFQRWGVGLVVLNRLVPDVRAWGVEEAELSWVLESNRMSRVTLEKSGVVRYKTYRIYHLE